MLKQRGYIAEASKIKNCEVLGPEERLSLLLNVIWIIDKDINVNLFQSNLRSILKQEESLVDLLDTLKKLFEGADKQINDTELNEVFNDTITKEINYSNFVSINNQTNNTPVRDHFKESISNVVENDKRYYQNLINETEDNFPSFCNERKRVIEPKGRMTLRKHNLNAKHNKNKSLKESKGLNNCQLSCISKNKSKFNNKTIEVTKSCSFSLSPLYLPFKTIEYSRNSNSKSSLIFFADIKKKCNSSISIKCNKQNIPYYHFLKPSDVIVDSSMSYLIKQNMFDHKSITKNNSKQKLSKTKGGDRNFLPAVSQKEILSNEINDYFKNIDQSFSIDKTKIKIYLWLIEKRMFKFKQIDICDIPLICMNGIFICELINKCEGNRFEVIHGINRKIRKESQINVNLLKALEHLKKKEAFPCRHLCAINEIKSGNETIIWELLEDMWKLYTNKLIRAYSNINIVTPSVFNREHNTSINQLFNSNNAKNSNMIMNNDQHCNIFDQQNSLQFYNTLIKQTCIRSKTKRENNPTIQMINQIYINDRCNKFKEDKKQKTMTTITTTKPPKKYLLF